MTPIPEAAKAYVALAGAIATALLGVFAADTPVGQVLTVVAVVATAITTYAVPNRPAWEPRTIAEVVEGPPRRRGRRNEDGFLRLQARVEESIADLRDIRAENRALRQDVKAIHQSLETPDE